MQYDKNTQEQMFALISSWKQSGLSQKAYCEQNQIRYYVFHYWYKRYRDEQLNSGEMKRVVQNTWYEKHTKQGQKQ